MKMARFHGVTGLILHSNFLSVMALSPRLRLSQHHTHTAIILGIDSIGTFKHTAHIIFTGNPPPTFIT